MPILIPDKLLFIHIPKTAGTTINYQFGLFETPNRDRLYYFDNNIEWDHATAEMLKEKIPEQYEKCEKFTVVRHPCDRIVSEYCFKQQSSDKRFVNPDNMSFDTFITTLEKKFDEIQTCPHSLISHFIPQHKFVNSDVKVFHYENIDLCFDYLQKNYSFEFINKKFMVSQRNKYQYYFNKKTYEIILNLYKEDFRIFNYSVDTNKRILF